MGRRKPGRERKRKKEGKRKKKCRREKSRKIEKSSQGKRKEGREGGVKRMDEGREMNKVIEERWKE